MKCLEVEKLEAGVAVLRICREDALNALNMALLGELEETLQTLRADTSIRALILTGDGDKSFVAGADIVEMQGMTSSQAVQFSRLGHRVTRMIEDLPFPTLAGVNGYALGGGMELALSCDFICASDTAVFGLPEVGLGVIPGFGGTVRLSKWIGLSKAKELIFSGARLSSAQAEKYGLVAHIYKKEEFWISTVALAKQIASKSAGAVQAAKRLMQEEIHSNENPAKFDVEAMTFGTLFGHTDQVEGMKAFVEKRKPVFVGHGPTG